MEWNRTLWSERVKTVMQILVIRQRRFLFHMELEQTQTDNKKYQKVGGEFEKRWWESRSENHWLRGIDSVWKQIENKWGWAPNYANYERWIE